MVHEEQIDVDGHRVRVTNLDKVIYPETGTTKGEVIEYYTRIAPVMLPHIVNRPATRKRWVQGVGTDEEPGEVFFQKNLDASTPDWVARTAIEHKSHTNTYPLVNDAATLVWLAQIAALEIHVPQWKVGPHGPHNPDRLVLDLDPGPGVGLRECVEVAKLCREILRGMGLDPTPVTSGSKGIHLYAGLDGRQTSDQVSRVAHELARALEADHPDLVVSDMKKSLREGKVLLDWSQNSAAKTTIAPYSLRGRTQPTVAAPRSWRELASPSLAQLDFREVLRRVKRRGDPLAMLGAVAGADTGTTTDPTGAHAARHGSRGKSTRPKGPASDDGTSDGQADPEPGSDRLATYRGKRNPTRTPEPFDKPGTIPDAHQSFVIQEHHARRLHHDFRLEHDGVLVSWALPKGVPPDTATNHLAVQTEDHPLGYGSFEGTIPKGEYGAGAVTIWDAGTYQLEKWRPGREIIVTLHGRSGGGLERLGETPVRLALIHTQDNNWLIHRMKDTPRTNRTTVSDPSTKASNVKAAQLRPMLATASSEHEINSEDGWAFEMKWDGIRALIEATPAEAEGAGLRVWTRNGNDVTAAYPELAELTRSVHVPTVLDAEIVALRDGRPDFGLLQGRFGLTKPREIERAHRNAPVDLIVFDVLIADGRDLTDQTYDTRRDVLTMIVTPSERIHVPTPFEGDFAQAFQASSELGLEGVVAKRRRSTYAVGRRSRDWLKVKHALHQEVVIVGFRPGKGERAGGIGSLLVAVPNGEGVLEYAGRVGTGLTDKALEVLGRMLRVEDTGRDGSDNSENGATTVSQIVGIPRADRSDAVWVTPELVGEVEFNQWTTSGRLRHPVWRGLRPDRTISGVRRIR